MRRLLIIFAVLFFSGISAHANMEGMMNEGMMPMMEKCRQMMKTSGDGMMMQDMMQMMMNMMEMQEKMMMGPKQPEKKRMMMDMKQMRERMQNMMMQTGMMMGAEGPQEKVKCAEEWLKKAIDLHEVHIKDPKTVTEDSQMEMMDQMKHAYECIKGGSSEKTEPHKH